MVEGGVPGGGAGPTLAGCGVAGSGGFYRPAKQQGLDGRYSENDEGAGEVLAGFVEIGIRTRIERGFDEFN